MSLECRYCERDLRGGHAPDCPIELISNAQSQYELTSIATTIANDYSLSRDEQSHLQELVAERAMDFQ